MTKNGLGEFIHSLPKINGDATTEDPFRLPDIPVGARAVGIVKKGSVIYELPPFTRYLVFHQTEPPQLITLDGRMMPLDIDHPSAVAK